MLLCEDGSIYTGITTDLKRRLGEHKKGKGSHFTRARGAVKMLYSEKCKDRSSASKREVEIKRMTREKKISLIKNKKQSRQ